MWRYVKSEVIEICEDMLNVEFWIFLRIKILNIDIPNIINNVISWNVKYIISNLKYK
jgi:hypothetical protein